MSRDAWAYDAAAVIVVAVVMPAGVMLSQSRRGGARAVALVLLACAAAHIGVFEHARCARALRTTSMRTSIVTRGGHGATGAAANARAPRRAATRARAIEGWNGDRVTSLDA